MPNRYTPLHESPKGPGDVRPSALQIVKDQDLDSKLLDKIFLVTGVSGGLGVEITRAIAASGATVYGTTRDISKAKASLGPLMNTGRVHLIHMELDKLASVRFGVMDLLKRCDGKLNGLIANAGIMMCPKAKTYDGFEMQLGTNHVAHFLLFQLLKDALILSSRPDFNSRVVMVSSGGYKYVQSVFFDDYNFEKEGSYKPELGYGQSKLANIWMANQVERQYAQLGLHATSVHPGIATSTGITRHIPQEYTDRMTSIPGVKNYLKSPQQAAASVVMCAIARQFEGVGGRYVEDCDWSLPESEMVYDLGPLPKLGYSNQTYNRAGEERLWNDSLKMVAKAL